jgi:hypothetical protein
MNEDVAARVRALLAQIAARMPMSEAEFRYRIEPLRVDRADAVRALLELLGIDAELHGVAVSTLHDLVCAADTETLIGAFRDARRPEAARAEIAQLISAVAADRIEELLDPREIHYLSLLSIDTLLDRLRDRAGMAQVVDLYRGSSRRERRALIDAISTATDKPRARTRLGSALDPLFPHETDESLRTLMIRRVASRTEPASARALGRWLGQAHGAERRRLREALRRLQHVGIRPTARSLEAWVSGVDATGSFNVGISFPGPLELRDIVLACISVDAGLRAMNVISSVARETAGEIGRALEEGQAIPVAPIDVPNALRHIEAGRRRTVELGRALPDGFSAAIPYLHRPLAVARPAVRAMPPAAVSRAQLSALVNAPAYASWTFSGGELSLPRGLAGDATPSSRRLQSAARFALRALEGSATAERLVAMLRHQSEVHRLRSEASLAARSLAAAHEIAERGMAASGFARRLVERSVVASLVRGPKTPRTDVRELLKRRIEETSALRRRAVAVLDLGEAVYRQLENYNERSTPSERMALAQMESLALAASRACVDEFSRDADEQRRLPGMEAAEKISAAAVRRRIRADGSLRRIEQRVRAETVAATGWDEPAAAALAAALVSAGRWFAAEVCLRRCKRGCLLDPESDGRALFFEPGHPAGLQFAPSDATAARSAGSVALRQHLQRRIDDHLALGDGFQDALRMIQTTARGPERLRIRRANHLLERLRELAREVVRIEEDPAWLYALVEETEQIARELLALHKGLLAATFARLVDEPRRLPGFRPDRESQAVWRRMERRTRRLGLIGLPLAALQAAADRLPSGEPLAALLRAAAQDESPRALRGLEELAAEFWRHTPRRDLDGRTPAAAAAEQTADQPAT